MSEHAAEISDTLDPATLNGDLSLDEAQRAAYSAYHRERNQRNARSSRERDVIALAGPIAHPADVVIDPAYSPSRTDLYVFFAWVARRLRERFGQRPLTILDLGCGSGVLAPILARAGVCGRYIGLDIAPHRAWHDGPMGELLRSRIIADASRLDVERLPRIDVLLSATALEHIEDDEGTLSRLARLLAPWGVQAHAVPGELGLDLYGPHGWRQYSPRCLRRLFPAGEIYRYGGKRALRVHLSTITRRFERGRPDGRVAHPRLYVRAVARARQQDEALRNNEDGSAMYGVWVDAAPAHTPSR